MPYRIFRFGDCEVDPETRQVRIGGVVSEPQPKALDLLLYLIEHRDRIVDKDELLSELWPGVVVTESALTQALRKARSMTGDDGERQAVIRTIQRRGFRFVAELRDSAPASLDGTDSGAAPTRSVAVLPFTDMSAAGDQGYFCDGMAEEIINALSRSGVPVVARTSSFAFKHRAEDVRTIGRLLGVTLLLEGSVRKLGEHLRVTAQAVDAANGLQLWSETWDRHLDDMFAIQDEIARHVARMVAPNGPGAAPGRRNAGAAITPAELYRRGLAYQRRYGHRDQRFAIELFNQARARDPNYALAWAALAVSHVVLYRYTEAIPEHQLQARSLAARAVALDPKLPEAWAAQGATINIVGGFAAAEEAFERAIALGPSSFEAHYYYARAATEAGQARLAARLFERAAEIEPDDCQSYVFAAQAWSVLGNREKVVELDRRGLAAAERALARDPTDARALTLGVAGLFRAGRIDEAREWIERASALEPGESYVRYNTACAYLVLGETEKALDELDNIDFAAMDSLGWVANDPDLDPIRDHPRFKALMARARRTGETN